MSEPTEDTAADADVADAILSLAGQRGPYTAQDRYRDFVKVFRSSPEGERVLRELLSWGHLLRPSIQGRPIDPLLMAIMEGERNFALRVLATVTKEPAARPEHATTERTDR